MNTESGPGEGVAKDASGEGVVETAPVVVKLKELVNGVNLVLAGVGQMLSALEPRVAQELANSAIGNDGTSEEITNEEQPIPSITRDDITKIIVQKVKQDRANSTRIGTILKSYDCEHVSELPEEKFEQFITDIAQL